MSQHKRNISHSNKFKKRQQVPSGVEQTAAWRRREGNHRRRNEEDEPPPATTRSTDGKGTTDGILQYLERREPLTGSGDGDDTTDLETARCCSSLRDDVRRDMAMTANSEAEVEVATTLSSLRRLLSVMGAGGMTEHGYGVVGEKFGLKVLGLGIEE
ncbi:hypothetical protein PIB30_033736 [Stylosanthes scabra]|uniref:Uncharacterized protein n=1 Tax=Stylosanthes scabra TaxID=79078 RepID=A0ABU6QC04_9FABA|nr:hypothetical protein [Stylosanthes scabra]